MDPPVQCQLNRPDIVREVRLAGWPVSAQHVVQDLVNDAGGQRHQYQITAGAPPFITLVMRHVTVLMGVQAPSPAGRQRLAAHDMHVRRQCRTVADVMTVGVDLYAHRAEVSRRTGTYTLQRNRRGSASMELPAV